MNADNQVIESQETLTMVSTGVFAAGDTAVIDGYHHRNPSTGEVTIREGFPPRTCWPSYDAELKVDVFTHRL